MEIVFPAVNRRLSENVFKEFGKCPLYIVYDSNNKTSEYIYNYCRYNKKGGGPIAAQIFLNRKVDAVVAGDIDERSFYILNNSGIKVYYGFPATCEQALNKLKENKLRLIDINEKKQGNIFKLKELIFYDYELTFDGKNILYDDWDFILKLEPEKVVPKNWISPINFSKGSYYLRLEVKKMKKTEKSVEFEISWCNFPEDKDPDIPHRCSYGHYCSFTDIGIYEHMAFLDDMELTTIDGNVKKWNWKNAWDSPFVLVKPYGENPFPIEFKILVIIFESLL